MSEAPSLVAKCYCGEVQVTLPSLPETATRCNCSFCSRAGAIWVYFPAGSLKIRAESARRSGDSDSPNNHYFCGRCGMHTHGDTPNYSGDEGTRMEQVNLNMIDDLDWTKVTIDSVDGRNSW